MKYIKKGILPILVTLLTFIGHKVQATHIVGADMTFSCQAKEWFEIDLTVRRDCINGDPEAVFDDPAYVGIYDAYGTPLNWLGSLGVVRMELVSVSDINPSQVDCSLVSNPVCVSEARYVGKVFLPFREKGYILGYQRCCRNATLNNILNPLETGNTSFVCITEESLNSCNSSPEFQDWPEIYVCVGEEINFNSAAIDPDGDQLVYQMYVPHAGASLGTPQPIPPSGPPYDEVEYAPGFSLENPLGSGTPLTIDSNTGVLSGVPGVVGQFLVGVLVEEWRDGVMLSKTRRNFEYNVRACGGEGELVNFTVPDISCGQTSVQFTNTSNNLSQGFVWNFNYPSTDPQFMSTEVSPTFNFPAEGTYTVRLTNADGTACNIGGGLERTVVISSGGTIDFEIGSGSSRACVGTSVLFNNTSTNTNQTFLWNFDYPNADPAFTSTEVSPSFSFPSAGEYLVRLTNTSGDVCTEAGQFQEVMVTVSNSELTASFEYSIECRDNQRILSFVSTAVEGNPDFAIGTTRYDLVINGVSSTLNGAQSSVVVPGGQDVSVQMVVGSSSGCSAAVSQLILGSEEPTDCDSMSNACRLELIASTICPNESVALSTGGSSRDCSYSWSPSASLDLTDPANPIASPDVTTTYTVTSTDAEGMTSTQSVTVTVEGAFLELEIRDNNPGGCSSTSANVTGLALNNPNNVSLIYEWSFDPNFSTVVASGETVEIPLGSESRIVYLRAGGGNFCGSNVPGLVVLPGLSTSVTSAPISICDTNTGTVSVAGTDPDDPITVVWEESPNITSDLNAAEIDIQVLEGDNFIELTYTATSAAGCTFTETFIVDVTGRPVEPNPDQEIMCGTTSIQFSLDPSYQDGDVLWDFGMINGVQVTSTDANPLIDFGMSGVFTGMLSSNSVGPCSFEPVPVATQVPEVLEINSDNESPIVKCAGADSTVTFSATSNGSIIVWTDQDNNLLNAGDEVTVSSADVSSVTGTVTDAFGCTESITFSFQDYMFDVSLSGAEDATCASGPVSLMATNNDSDANISYMWVSASGGVMSGADTDSPTVDPENAQDLILIATNEDLGCTMEFPYPIEGSSSIEASISATSTSITSGESTTLTVDTDAIGATYMWNDGSTEGPTRTVSPTETTTYTVTVTDENGCTAEASITIEVAPNVCTNFFIPTAFTPNGDGNNDELLVRSDGPIPSMDLQVLDRWGNEVFRTTNPNVGWNGFHNQNGNELSPDVYAYCLKVVCNGEETILAGNVTLIR